MRTYALALTACLSLLRAGSAAAEPQRVPLDQEAVIGGVGVACTGVGQVKNDPRWSAYPVRLEFADAKSNYLAGELVTLSEAKGAPLLEVSCEGPWLLLKLPPGRPYRVEARLTDTPAAQPRNATVKAPVHGQSRFVLVFPDAD
jgi:hypothetical protein